MAAVSYQKIESVYVDETPRKLTVYDIELAEHHYFFANGIGLHNCRLRNELEENDFSFSLGGGGVETGSTSVMTLNLPRIAQNAILKRIREKKEQK